MTRTMLGLSVPARGGSPDELRYRRRFLVGDTKSAIKVLAVMHAASFVYVISDIRLFRGSWMLWVLLGIRGMNALAGVLFIRGLLGSRTVSRADRFTGAALISFSTAAFAITCSRIWVGEIVGPLVAETGIAVVYYFALRGPLWQRSLAAVLALLGPLIMIFVIDPSVSGLNKTARLSMVVGFLGLHGVGLIAGRAYNQQRKARYDAEAHERRTNRLLTASLRALSIEKERAEELARARSTFIATMSHEFRTPMNAIINLSALQLDAELPPSSREDVSIIHESARS